MRKSYIKENHTLRKNIKALNMRKEKNNLQINLRNIWKTATALVIKEIEVKTRNCSLCDHIFTDSQGDEGRE